MKLSDKGPEHDRRWVVVDDKLQFLSQRRLPKMCLIDTALQHGELALSAPTMPTINVAAPSSAQKQVTVWKDTIAAQDCGAAVAAWLSEFLQHSCRLFYMPDATQRAAKRGYQNTVPTVGFADAYPLLLTTQASLDDFNTHLAAPISMQRFRPNIVLTGCSPYAEDQWHTLRISDLQLQLVEPCARCIVPSIDPATAEKQAAVTEALNRVRRRDQQTWFGQNVVYQGSGVIQLGDSVQII